MPFIDTPLAGCKVFEPRIWNDDRGYFFESFNARTFAAAGIDAPFVQDNQAYSSYGVLRGLHYQRGSHAQAKLVRVIEGEVLDVVVDLRPESTTYGQSFSIRLSAENQRQLYVPRYFAHGYAVLSPTALFFYKCDNYYHKAAEGGLHYADPALQIDWQLPHADVLLSPKDELLPPLGEHLWDEVSPVPNNF